MNKVPIRPRQIDSNKPLAVLREGKNVNFNPAEFVSVSKGTAAIITGMEKEEESEHHLQQVLCASQKKKLNTFAIPVPEIIDVSSEYESLYSSNFELPRHLITTQGLDADEKDLDYDIDTADENWLSSTNVTISYDTFETLMDCFEKCCGKKVPSLKEALALARRFTNIRKEIAIAVYDYWLEKRSCYAEGFIHTVKQDSQDPSTNNADCYIAFRRRSEKMQTRRHRRSDELSYEKMFRFHQSLLQLKTMVQNVYLREMTKKNLAKSAMQIDELRLKFPELDNSVYSSALKESMHYPVDQKSYIRKLKMRSENEKEFSRSNKRQHGSASLSKDNISDDSQMDSSPSENEFEFIRTEGSQYARTKAEFLQPDTMNSPLQLYSKYSLCNVSNVCHSYRNNWSGYTRPRIGRLGRRVLDRLHPTNDFNNKTNTPSFFAEVSEIPRKIPRLERTSAYNLQYANNHSDDNTLSFPTTTSYETDLPSLLRGRLFSTLDARHSSPVLPTTVPFVISDTHLCTIQNTSSSNSPLLTTTNNNNTTTTATNPKSNNISSEKNVTSLSLGHMMNGLKPGSANGSDSGMGSAPSTPPAAITTALLMTMPHDNKESSPQKLGSCNGVKCLSTTTTSPHPKRAFKHSVDASRYIKEYKADLPHKCFPDSRKLWKAEAHPKLIHHVLHESS